MIMEVNRTTIERPFFSICIPQYNRTAHLMEACRSMAGQTFKDFEVCISDDSSTDGLENELLKFMENTGLSFIYRKKDKNTRYDSNLRSAIGLARGRFCFLLGNDDSLASPDILAILHDRILEYASPGLIITNYKDAVTGERFRRVKTTGLSGSGAHVAAENFRNLSFVSGLMLDTAKAKEHATDKWDGSEVYQMYIGPRIVAQGLSLFTLDMVTVLKGIRIEGMEVDSYASRPRVIPCPIRERKIPLVMAGRVVADAISPYRNATENRKLAEKILTQLLLFTYPFWIFEYRRIQSWRYSFGICLGMRPRNIARELELSLAGKIKIALLYLSVTIAGLLIPIRIFDRSYKRLYSFAKSAYTGNRSAACAN